MSNTYKMIEYDSLDTFITSYRRVMADLIRVNQEKGDEQQVSAIKACLAKCEENWEKYYSDYQAIAKRWNDKTAPDADVKYTFTIDYEAPKE